MLVFAKSASVDEALMERPHKCKVGDQSREIVIKRPQPRGEDRELAKVLPYRIIYALRFLLTRM